jgi:hypothetical protein
MGWRKIWLVQFVPGGPARRAISPSHPQAQGEKANVRIVVQKDGGRVVLLYCSGLVVNVIDDKWFVGGFAGDMLVSSPSPYRARYSKRQTIVAFDDTVNVQKVKHP